MSTREISSDSRGVAAVSARPVSTVETAAESPGLTSIPVHPLLFAAFPILFLFAENAIQQVTLEPLWQPLGAAVAGAAVAFAVCAAVFRDVRRGAIVASVLVLLFFSFGHVLNVARESYGLDSRMRLAFIYGAIAIVAFLIAARPGRWVIPLTRAANVAAIVLFGFNLVRVGQFALGSTPPLPEEARSIVPISTPVSEIERRPDIYYIILDRYGNEETLREIYGFDNGPFLRELEKRGFTIARDSWANYFKTALSLTSSLSMDYLDGEALKVDGKTTFESIHRALRERLAVPATLKSLGYE